MVDPIGGFPLGPPREYGVSSYNPAIAVAAADSRATDRADIRCRGANDALAIQKAIDIGSNTGNWAGCEIQVAPGNYDLGSHQILLRSHTTLRAMAPAFTRSWFDASKAQAARFNITDTTTEAIKVQGGAVIDGIQFYYPDQKTNEAPTVYPATILLDSGVYAAHVVIKNCCAINPYYFINAEASHGHLTVIDTFGYPLKWGIKEDNGWGNSQFERIGFGPNWHWGAGETLKEWVHDNAHSITIGQSDWSKILHCMVYGYQYGIVAKGNNDLHITTNGVDQSYYPLHIEDCNHVNVLDNYFVARDFGGVAGTGHRAIRLTGTGGQHSVIANRINSGDIGIGINTPNCVIEANNILDFGINTDAASYGILMGAAAHGAELVGNKVHGLGHANTRGIWANTNDGFICNSNRIYNTVLEGIRIEAGCIEFVCVGNLLKTTNGLVDNSGAVDKEIDHNLVVA